MGDNLIYLLAGEDGERPLNGDAGFLLGGGELPRR